MKHLTSLDLFSLLSTPTEDKDYRKELERAYEEFLKEVMRLSQTGNDIASIIRKLDFTRIEFVVLQTFKLCGKGKKYSRNLFG